MADLNRRKFLYNAGIAGLAGACPTVFAAPSTGLNQSKPDANRILVVVELSGGNDGLNSVVPYRNDHYYRHRPTIGIPAKDLHILDDDYGLNPGMLGFQRLWESGDLAIVHGCGYDNPSFSHFTSMAYWHTAAPGGGDKYGWLGRLADAMDSTPEINPIINIGSQQSLAVKSRLHTPVVFDDPGRFLRNGFSSGKDVLSHVTKTQGDNSARNFLNSVATSANTSSALVQEAYARYLANRGSSDNKVDYGIAPIDLDKVAACIDHGLSTRLYHVSFRNNAFDTHVQQPALHRRLLSYACDAIHGFVRDIQAMGHGDRVAVLVYSEFGRRVTENANLGTDHGSANVMFLAGSGVNGGHYGSAPDLHDLTPGDNLKHTTDFRQVYATAIEGWLKESSTPVLNNHFPPLPVFT